MATVLIVEYAINNNKRKCEFFFSSREIRDCSKMIPTGGLVISASEEGAIWKICNSLYMYSSHCNRTESNRDRKVRKFSELHALYVCKTGINRE